MVKRGFDVSPMLAIGKRGEFFSIEDTRKIVKVVDLELSDKNLTILKEKLELAAVRWSMADRMQRSPTALMRIEKYERIEKAAINLLNELGIVPYQKSVKRQSDNNLPPEEPDSNPPLEEPDRNLTSRENFFNPLSTLQAEYLAIAANKAKKLGKSRNSTVRDAIAGIQQTLKWTRKLKQNQNIRLREIKTSTLSNTGDEALSTWVSDLAGIFMEAGWGKPGLSKSDVDGKGYSGPFFRFFSNTSIRVMKNNKSNEALGKFIQRVLRSRDKLAQKKS